MNKATIAIFVLGSLFGIQPVQGRTWQDIRQSGELRIGVPGDYAPLAFVDKQGKLAGFDIDMARSLGHELRLNVSFVPSDWPNLSSDLAADKFDMAMGGVTETPDRKARFALSAPVMKNGKIALTRCDRVGIFSKPEAIDRAGVRVIVNPGGTNQAYVDSQIKYAAIIRTQNNIASLQGIRDGSADIMFTDLIEGNYYQNQEPGIFCVASRDILPGTAGYKVYMMAKDKPFLLEAVNKLLAGGAKIRLAKQWRLAQ
ncbi:transporter substrate-binding domain-containing protein [Acerihabitans sp. KWT182]|uniref:Transporter substrate-binding domain-containing protein n=1 Tax=Acerihabitans sp. KWT182 TaxID=3157919 RepID=A0AAU7QFX2_9GAMM